LGFGRFGKDQRDRDFRQYAVEDLDMTPEQREHVRRLKIRLAALKRHAKAKDPQTGKSELAVAAGRASGRTREGDKAFGLDLALKRWHAEADDA